MKLLMSREQLDAAVLTYLREHGMIKGSGKLRVQIVVEPDDPDPTTSVRVEINWTPGEDHG